MIGYWFGSKEDARLNETIRVGSAGTHRGMDEITITANGRQLTLVGTHDLYLQWYRDWQADNCTLAKVTQDLPHGALCLDVGANIGVTAISLAVQRPDCRIIAFEPAPDNVDCLRRNVLANAIENIEVVEAAISDRHGSVAMINNGPGSAVVEGAPLRCRAVPLDDYADQSVEFVKIDVEGHEPYVFAGARSLFAKRRPLVLTEFNAWALLMNRYDPLAFAEAVMASFDLLGVYFQDQPVAMPGDAQWLLHQNVLEHGCINDLLLCPREAMPELHTMTEPHAMRALRDEVRALRSSTSWRMTAPLRAVARAIRRR